MSIDGWPLATGRELDDGSIRKAVDLGVGRAPRELSELCLVSHREYPAAAEQAWVTAGVNPAAWRAVVSAGQKAFWTSMHTHVPREEVVPG